MTHYGTKSASHAWRKARRVAESEGLHLYPKTINNQHTFFMGAGVVLVTRQALTNEGKTFPWYLVRSVPAGLVAEQGQK